MAPEHAPDVAAPWRAEEHVQVASLAQRGLALIVYSVISGTVAFGAPDRRESERIQALILVVRRRRSVFRRRLL